MSAASKRSNQVELDQGIRLFHQDEGAGQPVVFVRGLIEDFRVWNHQITAISRQCRTVAYSRFAHANENVGDIHESKLGVLRLMVGLASKPEEIV